MANEKRRLIDANALLELVQVRYPLSNQFSEVFAGCVDEIISLLIQNAPTVDAVEVVRCEHCKHRAEAKNTGEYFCVNPYYGMASGVELKDDDFCSYGERKDDVVEVEHGRWIICSDGYYPYCSVCNEEPKHGEMTDFCLNCGAKMDLED